MLGREFRRGRKGGYDVDDCIDDKSFALDIAEIDTIHP